MGLSFRYLVAEDDRTVTRVARSQYHRWFSEGETLPANRVGRDLRLLEAAVEMDHHRVVDVLRILPEVPAVLARGAMTVNLAWWELAWWDWRGGTWWDVRQSRDRASCGRTDVWP